MEFPVAIIVILFILLIKVYNEKETTKEDYAKLNQEVQQSTDQRILEADKYYGSHVKRAEQEYREILARANKYEVDKRNRVDIYARNQIERTRRECEKATSIETQKLKEWEFKRNFIQKFLTIKISEYPILAEVLAEINTNIDNQIANQLEIKKRPALKAADEIRKIHQEKRRVEAQNKAIKWELNYVRGLLPWLKDLEDSTIEPVVINPDYQNNNNDAAGYWLTPEEYNKLSTTEKYQLALDRYKKRRHKSKKEIGDEYEQYIGYCYEKAGYDVEYYGLEKGIEDLGRDLICKKGHDIQVVQCKCWSKNKMVHENVINQLFGTTFKYYQECYPTRNVGDFIAQLKKDDKQISLFEDSELLTKDRVTPVLITTTNWSDTAEEFAKALCVTCKIIPLGDYPVIKCNINPRTGEKIYHLPFDQQYKTCKIDHPGECYVTTVAEAEALGFRRAMRWHGNNK